MRTKLLAGAVLAVAAGCPLGLAHWHHQQLAAINGKLSQRAGTPVEIGGVDAMLDGSVRLSDIRIGALFAAKAMQAQLSVTSLLVGKPQVVELMVAGPQLDLDLQHGATALRQLVARLAPPARALGHDGNRPPQQASRLQRIVVSQGALHVRLADGSELTTSQVEITPIDDGVRIVTGKVQSTMQHPQLTANVAFANAALELRLPTLAVGRGMAVDGDVTLHNPAATADPRFELRHATLLWRGGDAPLVAYARVNDQGVLRPVEFSATLAPTPTVKATLHGMPLRAFGGLLPAAIDVEHATATGEVTARALPSDVPSLLTNTGTHALPAQSPWGTSLTTRWVGKLRVDKLVLAHARLDDSRVPVSPALDFDVTFEPGRRHVSLTKLTADVAPTQFELSGTIATSPLVAHVQAKLAPTDCAAALAAVPPVIRGPIDGLALRGTLQGQLALDIDMRRPPGDGVALATDVDASRCSVLADPPLADVAGLQGGFRHTFPAGQIRTVGPGHDGWVTEAEIPRLVANGFVAAEDGRFFDHRGFDPVQIARSLEVNLRDGKLARGGSTISQQLVKNSFLSARRNFGRKLQEAILTWRLEAKLTKGEILTRYLNIIELGPDIYGVKAAARYWFDLPLASLNPRQVAFLAALTSEPRSMTKRLRSNGGLDPQSHDRVAIILRAMKRDGVISPEQYAAAKDAGLGLRVN